MRRFIKRYQLWLLLGAVLLLIGLGCWIVIAASTRSMTRDMLAQIRTGMTLAEVEELLGGPADSRSYMVYTPQNPLCAWVSEATNDKGCHDTIVVSFVENRVTRKRFVDDYVWYKPRRPSLSLWQRFRRWLGL